MRFVYLYRFVFLFLFNSSLCAQGPISGFMQPDGTTDIAISYSGESYSSYFFGQEERAISNEISAIGLFIEHAVHDSFALVFTLPYLRIDEENKGIQDGILAIKYRNQYQQNPGNTLSMITSVGVSFPMSGYPNDSENPIGARATTFQGRFLVQQQFNFGFFYQIQTGIDFRLIPNALTSLPILFRAGYGARKFYADAWLEIYRSFNAGVDESLQGGAGSSWVKIGATVFYPISPKFGSFVGIAQFLSAENVGLSTRWNAGFTYKLGSQK